MDREEWEEEGAEGVEVGGLRRIFVWEWECV
jgi:hypothetical protein